MMREQFVAMDKVLCSIINDELKPYHVFYLQFATCCDNVHHKCWLWNLNYLLSKEKALLISDFPLRLIKSRILVA